MALHPDFPDSHHAILNPDIRWFPADEALVVQSYEVALCSPFGGGGLIGDGGAGAAPYKIKPRGVKPHPTRLV